MYFVNLYIFMLSLVAAKAFEMCVSFTSPTKVRQGLSNMVETLYEERVDEQSSAHQGTENVSLSSLPIPENSTSRLSAHKPKKDKLYFSGVLSISKYNMAMFILTVLRVIIATITMVINTLGCVTFWLLRKESSLHHFLLAINVGNSLSEVVGITDNLITAFGGDGVENSLFTVQFEIFSVYWSVAVRRFVYLMYLYVCLLCLLAVSFPMKPYHRRMSRYPIVTAAFILIINFSYHTYIIAEYKASFGDGKYVIAKSDLFNRNETKFNVVANIAKVLFCFIPLLLSLILNGILLALLKWKAKERKALQENYYEHSSGKRPRIDRNITIFTISSVFFVLLSLPSNALQLVAEDHPTLGLYKQEYYLYSVLDKVCILCQILSRLVGFVPYLALSADCRRKCIGIICFCRKRNHCWKSADTESVHPVQQRASSLTSDERGGGAFITTVSEDSFVSGKVHLNN